MSKKLEVLDAVLSNFRRADKQLYDNIKGLEKEEIKNILSEMNLADITQRNLFYWQLQTFVERYIFEYRWSEDLEQVSQTIAEAWNKEMHQKVDSALVKKFILYILKYPNLRKAFTYVCDGDLSAYKTYDAKPKLFLKLLIRYLICALANRQMNKVSPYLKEVAPLLFDGVSEEDIDTAFYELGFSARGKKLVYGRMGAYNKDIGLENLAFADGMRSILLGALNGENLSKRNLELKDLLQTKVKSEEDVSLQVEDFLQEIEQQVNVAADQQIETEIKDIKQVKNEVAATQLTEESVQVETVDESNAEDPMLVIENAMAALQTAFQQVKADKEQAPAESSSETEQELAIAKDEIKLLKKQLEKEKEKVAQIEEEAYTKILQAIAGEQGRYELSDLFEESNGTKVNPPHISRGLLVNLFAHLNMAIGLEEYTAGYELHQQFSVSKEELIKKFYINEAIQSTESTIVVELVKYGWALNGKVIVPPLVAEVKEEM